MAQIVDLTMGEVGEEAEELEIVALGEEVGIVPRRRPAPRRVTVPKGKRFRIRRTRRVTVPKGTRLRTPKGTRFTAKARTRVKVPARTIGSLPEIGLGLGLLLLLLAMGIAKK